MTVEVNEPIGGDWEVLNSNYKWTKLDSSTIGFEIPVDKDGHIDARLSRASEMVTPERKNISSPRRRRDDRAIRFRGRTADSTETRRQVR